MGPIIRLRGARVAVSATHTENVELDISRGRILRMSGEKNKAAEIPATCDLTTYDLSGHLILPGLINAHDHLEFNLFPRLGVG
jgi:cytosine/adenosine deaminase-related metal-dependent hydrolase